jgi:uroporphyrin-III C-methyltransferase
MAQEKKGSLIIVGTGINVVSQTTISAKSQIEHADIVFMAVSGATGIRWVESLNDNVVSLSNLYEEGKSRVQTYQDMVDVIANAVREGNRVCGAFYGHPGVFVNPTHKVIKLLRAEGYSAVMDPGISAEDCLVADLGIDPGATGCQAIESTQFLFYKHRIDPSCLLILWQVSLSGDHTLRSLNVERCQPGLVVLMDALLEYYPADHEVILYEAPTMALVGPRIDRMPLSELPNCKPSLISTLVVPTLGMAEFDHETLAKLGLTEAQVLESIKIG